MVFLLLSSTNRAPLTGLNGNFLLYLISSSIHQFIKNNKDFSPTKVGTGCRSLRRSVEMTAVVISNVVRNLVTELVEVSILN